MIEKNKEIRALLQLADDPDSEIYDTIAARLLGYGKAIIPSLENMWESTADAMLQERMESLIHRVHFHDLQQDLLEWNKADEPDLLAGAILIAKYRFPDLDVAAIHTQFERIRKNVWLELNNYLSPLEQVNIINSIIYNYYKLHGHELTERESKHFFINQVLDSKQGNPFSIGVIYLALCEVLDIPIFAINIPRQFIFAYIDTIHSFLSTDKTGMQDVQFYIDPINGTIYTHRDLDHYLTKINATDKERYFRPLGTRDIICKMLEELSLCYNYRHEEQNADEILALMEIINPDRHQE